MVLTEQEEKTIKSFLIWQAQASRTNDISFAMEARQKELGKPTYEDLQKDTIYQGLKTQHDMAAQACEPLMKTFKEEVKK